jgi:RNA polymerase sigma factor (sigma-70 family)
MQRAIVRRTPFQPMISPPPAAAAFESLPVLIRAKPDPPDIDENEFAQLYEANCELLVGLAVRKFQVPYGDAEGLAHEVFLSYLKRRDEIRELHKWLIGAICNASRHYWRQHTRNVEQLDIESVSAHADPVSAHVMDWLLARIAAGEAMAVLSPRYQHILRLRYYEGYSVPEIAEELGVTAKYAQKLVTKCLRRAEAFFNASMPREKK